MALRSQFASAQGEVQHTSSRDRHFSHDREDSHEESDASDDSGFGDDLACDEYIRQRMEKMKSVMNVSTVQEEEPSTKSRTKNESTSEINQQNEIDRPSREINNTVLIGTADGFTGSQFNKSTEEDEHTYVVRWESGLLGLLFKSDFRGRPIIRRVNNKGNTVGLEHAHAGDMLIMINNESLAEILFEDVLEKLRHPNFPMELYFRGSSYTLALRKSNVSSSAGSNSQENESRVNGIQEGTVKKAIALFSKNALTTNKVSKKEDIEGSPKVSNVDVTASGVEKRNEDDYDVIWREGPLGCGLKNRDGVPYVKKENNPNTYTIVDPEVRQIQHGDTLIMINDHLTKELGFKGTVRLLQKVRKPVFLKFRRGQSIRTSNTLFRDLNIEENLRDSSILYDKRDSGGLSPNQYTVLWKDGPLGINIKTRNEDNAVVISRITHPGLSNNFEVGDEFVRIAGLNVADVGIAVAFELLRTVQKPVVLVFEKCTKNTSRSTEKSLVNQESLNPDGELPPPPPYKFVESSQFQIAPEDSSTNGNGPPMGPPIGLPPPPDYNDAPIIFGAPPRFSDVAIGRVGSAHVSAETLPPPPAYADVFTISGWRKGLTELFVANALSSPSGSVGSHDERNTRGDSRSNGSLTSLSLPPPPQYTEFLADRKVQRFPHQYPQHPSPLQQRSISNDTLISTYSDLDDSGLVMERKRQAALGARFQDSQQPGRLRAARQDSHLPPPELWIRWSEGPLGITFKRTNSEIVISRITGAGQSKGIEQLRGGDVLISLNNQYFTKDLRLSETMNLLKALPKPVDLCFVLR